MAGTELKNWFESLEKEEKNEVIIFLDTSLITEYWNKKADYPNNIQLFNYTDSRNNIKGNNRIILKGNGLDYNKNSTKCILGNPTIIIKDEDSIKKFFNILGNITHENIDEINYYFLDKKSFDILLKMEENELIHFLEEKNEHLFRLHHAVPMLDLELIHEDKKILDTYNILSARFANYLYKFAYFDFDASSTKIGIEVRKLLGVKSKTINNIRTIDIMFPKGRTFKGYDLSVDKHLDIKIKIAHKLIKIGNTKKLDLTTIAEITELPIKKVKNLYRK